MTSNREEISEQIRRKLDNFNFLARSLQVLFVLLASTSVIFSLAVATFSEELNDRNSLKPFAYIATLSSTLVGAFSLNRKASDARTAWRILRVALMRYDSDRHKFSKDKLIEQYAEAEDTIGHVVFNPPKQEARTLMTENESLISENDMLKLQIDELKRTLEAMRDTMPTENGNPET